MADNLRCTIILTPATFCANTIESDRKRVLQLGLRDRHFDWQNVLTRLCDCRSGIMQETSSERLLAPSTSEQSLTIWLERMSPISDVSLVAKKCLDLSTDHYLLVTSCIYWSCGLELTSRYRVFLTVRLFQSWMQQGVDVERHLMCFWEDSWQLSSKLRQRLCNLISNLIHSGQSSIGRYMEWLVATGLGDGAKNANSVRFAPNPSLG